ncbi:MAG: hypothetical protein FWF12_02345 [Betaproteobacteria bacterium]|nr:hypothetical protein [Betaproteobacteria bacterium]
MMQVKYVAIMHMLPRLFLLFIFVSFSCVLHAKDESQILFGGDSLKISFPKEGSIFLPIYSALKDNIPGDNDYNLEIYILVPEGSKYNQLYVGTLYPNGGKPEIESVFFHNVDDSPENELLILVSHETKHYDSGGTYYTVYIFSREFDESSGGLKRLVSVEEKLGGGLEGIAEGKQVHAPYKNASDVRKLLKKLGY